MPWALKKNNNTTNIIIRSCFVSIHILKKWNNDAMTKAVRNHTMLKQHTEKTEIAGLENKFYGEP